jgi:diguanylate cyclase (GGDEF)-like protein
MLSHLKLRLTLRAKLALLNVIVVAALMLLAMLAWRMSGLQDDAQARQTELSRALAEAKQADMLHDGLRADVMASLLVGEIPAMSHADANRQVSDDGRALDEAMAKVAADGLPPELAERVAHVHRLTRAYADSAAKVVQEAQRERAAAVAALPGFDAQFKELMRELDEQAKEISLALQVANLDGAEAAATARRWLAWICAITVCVASAAVALTTITIRHRLSDLGGTAQAMADGDLSRRADDAMTDELGALGAAINRMAANLSRMVDGMRGDARRATFGQHLTEALDMADREQQVSEVASRAMTEVSRAHPMELLISDSSRAQMEHAAEHPVAGAPGCGVGSPYDCVAVRRGTVVTFGHSEELNACAQLRGRPCGPVSAVCVPVTFMGRAIGVLHSTGSIDEPLSAVQAQQLGTLGAQLGMRLGTVRAFEKTQIQAATDALTGLPNRRTIEQRLHAVAASGKPYAVVMCDLDRFKLLNDTHGHATGDAALRVFAEVMRASVRDADVGGRWGGEEFTMVLADCQASAAHEIVERMRKKLAATLKMGKTPAFTASFGIADSSMASRSSDLIQLADVALYHAKASGRDRACIADLSVKEVQPAIRRAESNGAGIEAAALAAQEG